MSMDRVDTNSVVGTRMVRRDEDGMTRHYLLADESGNLDFSRSRGATMYFAVGTVHIVGDEALETLRLDVLRLQTDLGWRLVRDKGGFHASEDNQATRDEMFALLQRHVFYADVTVIENRRRNRISARPGQTSFGLRGCTTSTASRPISGRRATR
jgi:hypothetical protein